MERETGLTLLHDDCSSCGAPVDVFVPPPDAFKLSLNNTRGEWFHDPSSARCAACALREASDCEHPQLELQLRKYQRLKSITGLPDYATLCIIHAKSRVHAISNEIVFGQYPVRASARMPENAKIPYFYFTPDDLKEDAVAFLFQVWDFATPKYRATAR